MCGMRGRRCLNKVLESFGSNKLSDFSLRLKLFHYFPLSGVWWWGSAPASTWLKAQVLWSELHRGGVQESQLRGCFSSGYFELRGCFSLGFSVRGWLPHLIFVWRPKGILVGIVIIQYPGDSVLVRTATSSLAKDDVSAWRRVQVSSMINDHSFPLENYKELSKA